MIPSSRSGDSLNFNFLIKKFLNGWQPSLALFVDSEIWPNFLTLIKKNNPFEKLNIGDKLYIEIIKVLDDKNYLFQCSKEGYTYSQIFTKID